MKRTIVFFLMIILLCFAAACSSSTEPTVTAVPTEIVTAQPSALIVPTATAEVQTETPTEAVSPMPTNHPTETPAPEVISFEDCAEEILRLTPYKAYDGPLPTNAPSNSVLYLIDDGSDISSFGPLLFAVDGETKVVCDFGVEPIRGMYMYDANGQLVCHSEIALSDYRLAVLSKGVLYTVEGAFDVESGSLMSEYSIPDDVVDENMQLIDLMPKMIFSSASRESGIYTLSYDYYEIDSKNMWAKTESLCKMVEDSNGKWTRITFASGTELTFDGCGYSVLGKDRDGNFYFTRINKTKTVIKVSPDGLVRSILEIPYTFEDLWDNLMLLNLAEDGTLYIGASLPDEFMVWAVSI